MNHSSILTTKKWRQKSFVTIFFYWYLIIEFKKNYIYQNSRLLQSKVTPQKTSLPRENVFIQI